MCRLRTRGGQCPHTRAKRALPSAAWLSATLLTATHVDAEEEVKSSGSHVYGDLGGEVVCVYMDIYTHIYMHICVFEYVFKNFSTQVCWTLSIATLIILHGNDYH